VEPDNFDRNFPTLEFALEYLGCVRVMRRHQGVAPVVPEFHRIWDRPVAATKLAQLIKFCRYFIIRHRAFLELLQNGR